MTDDYVSAHYSQELTCSLCPTLPPSTRQRNHSEGRRFVSQTYNTVSVKNNSIYHMIRFGTCCNIATQ